MWSCRPGIAAAAFFFGVAALGLATAPLHAQNAPAAGQRSPEQLWDQAQAAIGQGRYDRAVKLLEQYMVLEPDDPRGPRDLARVLSWQGKHDRALTLYDRMVKERPYDTDLAVERARVLGWKGDYAGAETAVREVLRTEPEHVDANLLLAALLEWQRRPKEAEKIYAWVLKFDPGNTTARQGRQQMRSFATVSLEWDNTHMGDNQDFYLYASQLGFRFSPLTDFSLKPFAALTALTDRTNDWRTGTGGGLEARWQVVERLRLGARTAALYYPDNGGLLDWGGGLSVDYVPLDWLSVGLSGHTSLYGQEGQSVSALAGELRAWGGQGTVWLGRGRFSLFGLLAFTGLVSPDHDASLVTTGMLQPMVRVAGEKKLRFSLGYKLWYTGHSKPSPVTLSYWSPAQYMTHHLVARLDGPAGPGTFYVEAGGGPGLEYELARAQGTPFEQDARWTTFPTVQGAAGLEMKAGRNVSFKLSGWTTWSQRTVLDETSKYLLWNADFNLMVRW